MGTTYEGADQERDGCNLGILGWVWEHNRYSVENHLLFRLEHRWHWLKVCLWGSGCRWKITSLQCYPDGCVQPPEAQVPAVRCQDINFLSLWQKSQRGNWKDRFVLTRGFHPCLDGTIALVLRWGRLHYSRNMWDSKVGHLLETRKQGRGLRRYIPRDPFLPLSPISSSHHIPIILSYYDFIKGLIHDQARV